MKRAAAVVSCAALWLVACSGQVDMGRRCSQNRAVCAPAAAPAGNGGGAGGAGASGSGSGGLGNAGAGLPGTSGSAAVGTTDTALGVHVQDVQGMTIEIVTLACAGDCADIEAVAHGGNPPYSFAWEDGSTSATRHVCLDASKQLSVSATDTAIADDEFSYAAHTASTQVTATTLDCTDAGTPSHDLLCVEIPSFEGTPQLNLGGAFDATPWIDCFGNTADVFDANNAGTAQPLIPTDGATYVNMDGVSMSGTGEFVSQELCAPIAAGTAYSFTIDAASPSLPSRLAVYTSSAECGGDELLFTSAMLDTTWTHLCVTLEPTKDAAYLSLTPMGADDPMGYGTVFVDNLVPVEGCP